jgi:hypothetical protein
VMLFAGSNGYLNIGYDGSIGTSLAGNFLVRSRELFASKGLAARSWMHQTASRWTAISACPPSTRQRFRL